MWIIYHDKEKKTENKFNICPADANVCQPSKLLGNHDIVLVNHYNQHK